jgi:uncharacterized repeat protein (TIGR04042 family)
MPAVNFEVTWPDGENAAYYSPSTVIHQYIKAGESYSVKEFERLTYEALDIASERVRAKFGYACSAANDEKIKIEAKATQLHRAGIDGEVLLNSVT